MVIAVDKDSCIKARNDLGKRIKEEFLHEEILDKRQNISKDAKSKIVQIIVRNGIESFKGNAMYFHFKNYLMGKRILFCADSAF